MPPGALTVQDDGTLTVVQRPDEDTAAFEAALARFTELVCPTAGQHVYRLTVASVWRARRAGLTLSDMLQTLETSSTTALPSHVRADLERWSRQIGRLTLEVDQGRLLLRSTHPLVLTAVRRHRTLGTFITHQLDAATVALRADAYPELIQTFDACGYPVLDHVPGGWTPDATSALPVARPMRPVVQPLLLPVPTSGRRRARVEGLRRLPRPCQATTQAGRPCKNRARPASRFCRVHAAWSPQELSRAPYEAHARLASQVLEGIREPALMILPQLAVYRVVVLMGIGLFIWLLSLLLMRLGRGVLPLALPPWVVAGLSLVGTCGLVGRLGARLGLVASLHMVLLLVTSVLLDCLHKEGLILHLCFVVIPVVIPAVVLSHLALSLGWVFVCFPVGVVLGLLFYTFLDAMST
jgi:Helicase conserved C-terminal domain